MSNFCLTSKGNLIDNYKAIKVKAGYSISCRVDTKLVNYLSFHKLIFKNENFLSIGDDFIGAMGTLIFKESTENMLLNLYNDWEGDINEIRQQSIGSYCVIIKKDDLITVFGEENYMYNIYYYITDNSYILSNSFFDIQTIYGAELEIDRFNFLEMVFNTYVLCNETIFKDVKRLCGDEYILIDLVKNKAEVKKIKVAWLFDRKISYPNRIKKLSENLVKKTKIICDAFGAPALCMTGGLDSRLCLAPVLANGLRPNLFYGVGNSILTDTKEMDLKINQMYAEKFGLSLEMMDWSTSLPIDKDWQKYFDRYSESFTQYNASSCVFESLEKVPNHYMIFGYFGELYRNLSWIENMQKEFFTIDEYVDDYFMQQVSFERLVRSTNVSYEEFREHIKEKMIKLCIRYEINPNKINVDEYRYLYLEYLRVGCSIMLNLVNKMRYISYPIAEDDVYKYCSLSRQENLGAQFMLDMYKLIFKPVLEIPFFTHCEIRNYNTDKGVLDPPASDSFAKITRHTKFMSKLLPLSLKLWFLRTFVTKDSKAIKDESSNDYINEIINKYVGSSFINGLNFSQYTHRNYILLAMYCFIFSKGEVMKTIFFVHSHITYLAALAVIQTEHLLLKDILILSISYNRDTPIKVHNILDFVPKGNLIVKIKRKFLPQFDSDYAINYFIGDEPFVLYLAWPVYHCKFLMTHPNCKAFHFIEEGLSAYWNNMSLDEILFQRAAHQNIRSSLSLSGIKERLIDAMTVFRGYNTAIQHIPNLYFQYISDNRVHFYGFCEDSFCLAFRNKHVMNMAESLKNYNFEGIPSMDNSVVYISDYNTASHMSYEDYLLELDELSRYLTERNIDNVSIKWHYKCSELLNNKLTAYIKSKYHGHVTIIHSDIIMEIVFITSQRMLVLGNNSSLLFYAALSGQEALSLAKERNDGFEVYWRKVKLISA